MRLKLVLISKEEKSVRTRRWRLKKKEKKEPQSIIDNSYKKVPNPLVSYSYTSKKWERRTEKVY